MGIEIIDPKAIALREKKRTVVMNTRKLHAWVHYYPNPGDHDELHCHNEDQVFTCFEGECTMRFPDGGSAVLKPGMAALITGGSFYQLVNSGDGPMIMMGHRSGNQDNVMIIDYVTRQDIRKNGGPKVRRGEAAAASERQAGVRRCYLLVARMERCEIRDRRSPIAPRLHAGYGLIPAARTPIRGADRTAGCC